MYGYGYRYSIRPGYVPFNPLTDIDGLQLYLNKNTNVNTKLAQDLNGTTDGLVSTAVLSDLQTSTGTWAGWVRPTLAAPSATTFLAAFGDTDTNEYCAIRLRNTGLVDFICKIGGVNQWVVATDSAPFSDNTWSHVCCIMDGVEAKIFINGVEVAQTFSTTTDKTKWMPDATGIDNGTIGYVSYLLVLQGYLDGSFDEWGFWNNATSITASDLYNSGNGLGYDSLTTAQKVGLKGYYSMDDLLDKSGNSNTLTTVGTPTTVIGKVQTETQPTEGVFSWVDQSTNGFVFSQSTVTKQPLLASDGNSIDFDGTDDILTKVLSNPYSGDSSGIIFVSGYYNNTTQNRLFNSADNGTTNNYLDIEIRSGGVLAINYQDGTSNIFTSTNTITNGAYYYGYIKSTGTAWEINLNGNIETLVTVSGTNTGNWFADISGADALNIGGILGSTPTYGNAKANKIIYSNDYTIDTTPILNFLSNPDN